MEMITKRIANHHRRVQLSGLGYRARYQAGRTLIRAMVWDIPRNEDLDKRCTQEIRFIPRALVPLDYNELWICSRVYTLCDSICANNLCPV
jgi:hypothetical protein